MNKVFLIANMVKDVELRASQNGTAVGRFTLAVNRIGKEETDYINCVVFGKQAETMAKYTSKGSKIAVEGRIQTGSYEKDGQTRYTTDVVVERIEFLNTKTSAKNTQVEDKNAVYKEFGESIQFSDKEMEIDESMLPF